MRKKITKQEYIDMKIKEYEQKKENLLSVLKIYEKDIEDIKNITDKDFLDIFKSKKDKELEFNKCNSDIENILKTVDVTLEEFDNMDFYDMPKNIIEKINKLSTQDKEKIKTILSDKE